MLGLTPFAILHSSTNWHQLGHGNACWMELLWGWPGHCSWGTSKRGSGRNLGVDTLCAWAHKPDSWSESMEQHRGYACSQGWGTHIICEYRCTATASMLWANTAKMSSSCRQAAHSHPQRAGPTDAGTDFWNQTQRVGGENSSVST